MQIISRIDARISDQKRFFTGKLCCKGHVSEMLVSNGRCVKCSAESSSLYRKRHSEKVATYNAKNYQENKQRFSDNGRKWREENKDKNAANKARYYQENKEMCLSKTQKFRDKNKEKYLARAKKWREENRDLVRLNRRKRKLRVKNAEGFHVIEDIKRILSLQKRTCAACYTKFLGNEYHVDHIVPLALGGSNWASNLQMLCPTCNMSKGAKAPLDFYVSRGFLL